MRAAACRIAAVPGAGITVVARGWAVRLARVPNAIAITVALIGVQHRRTVVEHVGNLVPVLILQGVDYEVGLAVARQTIRTVIVRAADPLLATAGPAVAERPRRAVGRSRTR